MLEQLVLAIPTWEDHLWQYLTVVRVIWLIIFVLIWACYQIPRSDVVETFDPLCRMISRYLIPCAFVMCPHTRWGDTLGALWIGRYTSLYLRFRRRLPWRWAIITGLLTHPLLSILTFATMATLEQTIILQLYTEPYVSQATPTLHQAVISTYDIFSVNFLNDTLTIREQQIQAFCYLDSLRDRLFGPDQRVHLTARARKLICPRDRPLRAPLIAHNLSKAYEQHLLDLTDDLAQPLLYWHSYIDPLAPYVIESAQRLQYLLTRSRPDDPNPSLRYDNIFAIDPVIHSFCMTSPTILCAWFPFRAQISAIFSTTWHSLSSSLLRTEHSHSLDRRSRDLFSALCVFTSQFPTHLPNATAFPPGFFHRLETLPWLPEVNFAPATASLFVLPNPSDPASSPPPALLTSDPAAILLAQQTLGLDPDTAAWANFVRAQVHETFHLSPSPITSERHRRTASPKNPISSSRRNTNGADTPPPDPAVTNTLRALLGTGTLPAQWLAQACGPSNPPLLEKTPSRTPRGEGAVDGAQTHRLENQQRRTGDHGDGCCGGRMLVPDAFVTDAKALTPLVLLKRAFDAGTAVPGWDPRFAEMVREAEGRVLRTRWGVRAG